MSLPSDPVEALKWVFNHSNEFWWVWGAIAAGIAWTSKRMRDWSRRNAADPAVIAARAQARSLLVAALARSGTAAAARPSAPQPSGPAYTAAPTYAASAYAAQPAYAAPPAAAPSHAGSAGRKLHRESAPAQRGVTPVARSVDVPVPGAPSGRARSGAWTLADAFGDAAHARTAIVIAEVLGPPVGLR